MVGQASGKCHTKMLIKQVTARVNGRERLRLVVSLSTEHAEVKSYHQAAIKTTHIIQCIEHM